jgi:hypothetical protein
MIQMIALRPEAGRSERQWKSVLSWMLGIAGARQILTNEGYRWIAPLSAFYPNARQTVDLSAWTSAFPASSITVTRRPDSRSRFRPDYLALRSTMSRRRTGVYDWAIAEAKGTLISLTNLSTCPIRWSNQARNVAVTVNGSEVNVPRHLVIATRVNPNAVRRKARYIQVRAWNRRNEPEEPQLTPESALDIVAAHLFGVFRGLQLRENALAVALAVQLRADRRRKQLSSGASLDDLSRVSEQAENELSGRIERSAGIEPRSRPVISVETDGVPIEIELAEPLIALARKMRETEEPELAEAVLERIDHELDSWETERRKVLDEETTILLPSGLGFHFPAGFDRRGH